MIFAAPASAAAPAVQPAPTPSPAPAPSTPRSPPIVPQPSIAPPTTIPRQLRRHPHGHRRRSHLLSPQRHRYPYRSPQSRLPGHEQHPHSVRRRHRNHRSRPPSPCPARNVPARPHTALPPTAQAAPAAPSPGWRQAVAAWLAAHKTYPDDARRQSIEGTVVVRFRVEPSGRVSEVDTVQGSGSFILDDAATAMLRDAMLPPPGGTAPVTIVISIRYALEN